MRLPGRVVRACGADHMNMPKAVFVFLSLIEYAFVNVMMGDISEVEQKAKKNHLRNITYQIVLT